MKTMIEVPLTFAEAKASALILTAEADEAGRALNAFPKNAVGLPSDAVRATDDWKRARSRFAEAFAKLRDFNGVYVKRFAKELRAERDARRAR